MPSQQREEVLLGAAAQNAVVAFIHRGLYEALAVADVKKLREHVCFPVRHTELSKGVSTNPSRLPVETERVADGSLTSLNRPFSY